MAIRIFFAGDFVSGPDPALIHVSEELKAQIQECDIRCVGFEVPLKPQGMERPMKPYKAYFQHDKAPQFLKELGFNVIPFCSNHTFDCKLEGFFKTKEALGETTFGSGTYEEAYRIKVMEVGAVKIGFMAVCYAAIQGVFDDVTNHEGYGCAYINDMRVNHVIHEAKQQVDYLFVLPHDGIEYLDAPMPEIIARYHDFIDWGADGVMASHPHSPQGWENYKGKPIFYSLANLFFNSGADTSWVAKEPHWYEGRCVKLTIEGTDMSWEVINTRNVRNEALDIDNSEKSELHNELICSYLQDKEAYNAYMMPVQEEQFRKDMRLIQKTFKPKTVREAISVLKECFKMRLHGQKPMSGEKMMYMLKNDLKRNIIVRVGVKN